MTHRVMSLDGALRHGKPSAAGPTGRSTMTTQQTQPQAQKKVRGQRKTAGRSNRLVVATDGESTALEVVERAQALIVEGERKAAELVEAGKQQLEGAGERISSSYEQLAG